MRIKLANLRMLESSTVTSKNNQNLNGVVWNRTPKTDFSEENLKDHSDLLKKTSVTKVSQNF